MQMGKLGPKASNFCYDFQAGNSLLRGYELGPNIITKYLSIQLILQQILRRRRCLDITREVKIRGRDLLERKCIILSNLSLVEQEATSPDILVHICKISGSNFSLNGTFENTIQQNSTNRNRNTNLNTNTNTNTNTQKQGGRTWQPFVGGKNGHEFLRQARIYNFCNKCVIFARNRKFAKLTQ